VRTLVWFRGKDLRLADHAPVRAALDDGEVVPLFVVDPYFFAPARAAELPHRIQFLLESLVELAEAIAKAGSRLLIARGKSVDVVPRLARAWKVDRVVAHRWVEPFARARDARIAAALDVPFELHEGETLHVPGSILSGGGTPYAVFTPFARAFAAQVEVASPLPAPRRIPPLPAGVAVPREIAGAIPMLADLDLVRNPRLLEGGEAAGRARLAAFVAGPGDAYATGRDRMDLAGTSRLSVDLKFGTLSSRAIWQRIRADLAPAARASFANELVWREFTHALLWHHPTLLAEVSKPAWRAFPWRRDEAGWRAWAEGATGYPVVDAAARQLLAEGFVHNRARMIAASFLTKHLMIDLRRGEAHYLRWLTDGDWANNDAGWQWTAGCGADAQPYFRVFNPIAQGERHDPDGGYVRRWVPELARLPARWIHRPWEAPAATLADAGVVLGRTYPRPIVAHELARARFLEIATRHLRAAR
jgi:deoxyribodipyrimidine photo-lyase